MRRRLALCVLVVTAVCSAALALLLRLKLVRWRPTGSRYVSWLPSFSVEVRRARPLPASPRATPAAPTDTHATPALTPALPAGTLRRIDDIIGALDMSETRAPPPSASVAPAPPRPEPELEPEPLPEANSTDPTSSDRVNSVELTQLGGKFSKSATERSSLLQRRKEALIASARRRYLDKLARGQPRPASPAPAPAITPAPATAPQP